MKVSKQSKVMLLAAGLALLAPSVMKAQQPASARAAEEASIAAKSLQVVNDLKAIKADRAAAEFALLSRWESVMDPNHYDLRTELAPLLAKAPEWQLYGASLANDFSSMISVLRGGTPASRFIDPSIKEVDGANAFGDRTDSLVFFPIAPCRIVDTRGTGARTGVLGAGAARTFDLTSTGFAKGQGGSLTCPGLPADSPLGWAVNVTVTGFAGNGWLTIWPSEGVEPLASQLNYSVGQWSLANGVNLTGCDLCADDIVVRANLAGTHVIVDVMGYFTEPISPSSTVTRLLGPSETSAAGARQFVSGAACPGGTVLVGGDIDHGGSDTVIGEQTGVTTTYVAWIVNNDGFGHTIFPYSRCLETPVRVQ